MTYHTGKVVGIDMDERIVYLYHPSSGDEQFFKKLGYRVVVVSKPVAYR